MWYRIVRIKRKVDPYLGINYQGTVCKHYMIRTYIEKGSVCNRGGKNWILNIHISVPGVVKQKHNEAHYR